MSHPVHTFVPEYDVVGDCSAREKNTLLGIDDVSLYLFGSVCDGTSNDFVRHIAQTYGSELFHRLRFLGLRNKSNNCGVPIINVLSIVEYIKGHRDNLLSNDVRSVLIKYSRKAIGPRGL